MQIALIRKGEIKKINLPQKISGQHIITFNDNGNSRQLLAVSAKNDRWIIKPNRKTDFLHNFSQDSEGRKQITLKENEYYSVVYIPTGEKIILFVEPENREKNIFSFYKVPFGRKLRIGDDEACDVYFHNNVLSETVSASIEFISGKITVRDEKSVNGTYLNGKRVENATAGYGDELYLVGLRIIIGKSFIAVNNPDRSVRVNLEKFQQQPFVYREEDDEETDFQNTFSSAPRYIREIKTKKISVENPPKPREEQNMPWAVIMGPSITMAFGSVFSSVFTIQNVMRSNGDISSAIPTLVMSVCMVLGTIIWPIFAKRFEKRARIADENRQKREYLSYLEKIEEEIEQEIRLQEEIKRENNPTLEECISRINNRHMSLWERSTFHNDFLEVMLGIGNLPMNLELNYQKRGAVEKSTEASEAMYKLVEKPRILENVPMTISFRNSKIVGLTGDRVKVIALAKALLIELTALHNYNDLKIILIYNESEREIWESAKWLPHIFNNDRTMRYVVNDIDEAKEMSNVISNIGALYDNSKDENNENTHYIIISADRILAEKIQSLKDFTQNPQKYGNLSLLALYDERKYLPKACSVVARFNGDTLEVADFNDTTGESLIVKEPVLFNQDPDSIFVNMANIELDVTSRDHMLPTDISFFDMFKSGKPEHLDVISKWEENHSENTLAAAVGVDVNGYEIKLDIHEKAHGPHGLIAGMTGSGKSEFIISYIASLAINYSPEEVAFVLIDFKGGGMADVFRQLPHLAGSITNLDGNELQRSFIAIESELEKRQKLFKEISRKKKISNIDIYKYQKLRRSDKTLRPLPHLIIISDEFAELKQQHPLFMEQLIRIARIGRSLGVHLILATQKPDGVVDDQIKSNIKFKICLKVQDKSDSQSVIDRPDATMITNAGRFYMQVGYNEIFEYGQSPWSGAPYYPADQYVEGQKKTIDVLNEQAQVIYKVNPPSPKRPGNVPEKQIDALVLYLSSLAKEKGYVCEKLWLEPLKGPEKKNTFSENESTDTVPFVLAPVVGQYDDLHNRIHKPLIVPLTNGGNTVVYGAGGSGKLAFLNQLLYYLVDRHSPEEVNIFILDFDSGALSAFADAPHIPVVAMSGENEVIRGVFEQLENELNERRELFKRYGGDYQNYIKSSGNTVPNLVIVINNFLAFTEEYPQGEDLVSKLAREGNKYGVFVVISALDSNSVRYRLVPLFSNFYVLRQNNAEQYTDILGKTGGIVPANYVGRGIFKKNDTTYEFQTTMLFEDRENTYDAISEFCKNKAESCGYRKKEIRLMPENVTQAYFEELGEAFDNVRKLPVAVDRKNKETLYLDCASTEVTFIAYDDESKSSALVIANAIIRSAPSVTLFSDGTQFEGAECISTDKIAEKVTELENLAYARAEQAQKELGNGGCLPDFEHKYVIIFNHTQLCDSVSAETAFNLNNLVSQLTDNYHINFIIIDHIANYRVFVEENRLGKTFPVKNGIAIGQDVRCPKLFEQSLITEEITDNDLGYIVLNNKLNIGKIITQQEGEK